MQQAIAQMEYKRRHDKVTGAVHWSLCNKYNVQCSQQWYQHTAESVIHEENVKILWDVNIQTDHVIEHRWSDIVVIDKENNRALIIDIAVPGDTTVDYKEQEKVDKYQDLANEIKRLWKVEARYTRYTYLH